jgi:tetratricopeptide (TPR) repeat protein
MSKKQNAKIQKSINPYNKVLLRIALILIATFITYSPALKNGFTNWDDNVYIGENNYIKSLSSDNIKAIFDTKTNVSLNYHPLTILSLAIDYKLSGYNPRTYHFTNLFFHLLNTTLVFLFVYLLSNKNLLIPTITSIAFAIHPMHVESVAWVSERKDVLYVFFFLLSLIGYLKFLNSEKNKPFFYILTLLLFVFSCLSKAMAVVLPMILFLIDYFLKRKISTKTMLEKMPFLVIAFYYGWIALKVQSQGAISDFEIFTWVQRISFTSYGFLFYIVKFFVPINLSCYYPYPNHENVALPIIYYLAPFVVLMLTGAIAYSAKKSRVLIFSYLFYFFAVALVLQFISVGQVITADRYSYLAYVGIAFPIAFGLNSIYTVEKNKYKKIILPALVLVAIVFSIITYNRIQVWKNGDTLWSDAISKYPHAETYRNRGSYLVNKPAYDLGIKSVGENEYDRALIDFNNSVALSQKNPKVFTNRANIFGLRGMFNEALQDYIAAIKLDSTDAQTYFNQGVTYGFMKDFTNSVKSYSRALVLQPTLTKAKFNRAYDLINAEKYQEAIVDLDDLLKVELNNADYYYYRGYAYLKMNKWQEALADHNASLAINPNNANVNFNRSIINNTIGNFKEALEDALNAQKMGYAVDPNYILELSKK